MQLWKSIMPLLSLATAQLDHQAPLSPATPRLNHSPVPVDPIDYAPVPQPPNTTLYFGYGSNLWLKQMRTRCPHSTYLGIAQLPAWHWLIYARGYANIVPSHNETVYALVFALTPADEAALDRNEGVPIAYQKERRTVDFWPADAAHPERRLQLAPGRSVQAEALVYVNRREEGRTEGSIREEYVCRMNAGIRDAVERGVPKGYVERVLRRWVPVREEEECKKQTGDWSGR